MALKPVVELGVAEAYELLSNRFGVTDLPPLDAIENEDWGRDYLLSQFQQIPEPQLLSAGLRWDEGLDAPDPPQPRDSARAKPSSVEP